MGRPRKVTATSKEGHLPIRRPNGTTTISPKLAGSRGIHHAVTAIRRIGISITR